MAEKYSLFEDEAIFYFIKSINSFLSPIDFFMQLMNELQTTYKKIYPQQIELLLRKIEGCNKYIAAIPLTLSAKVNSVALLPQTADKEYSNALAFAQVPNIKAFDVFMRLNGGYKNYQENFEALADTGLLVPRKGSMLSLGLKARLN
jgi:hypothetical protein